MRLVTVLFPSFSHIQLALASPLEPPVWFLTPEVPAGWIRPVNRPSVCLGTAGCWGFIWVMSEDLSTHQSIWDMFWPCSYVPLSYDLSLLHWTLVVLFQFGWKSVQVLTTEWINFSMKGKCTSLTYKVNFRAVHSQIMLILRGFCALRRTRTLPHFNEHFTVNLHISLHIYRSYTVMYTDCFILERGHVKQ